MAEQALFEKCNSRWLFIPSSSKSAEKVKLYHPIPASWKVNINLGMHPFMDLIRSEMFQKGSYESG